jgi:pyridoxal phosphate enzyme (YggS family)
MNGNPALEQRYRAVMDRIRRAAEAAGRQPDGIRLLAVGKTFSAGAIGDLAALGQLWFGENYLQEALGKIAALAHLRPGWAVGEGIAELPDLQPTLQPAGHPGLPAWLQPAEQSAEQPALRQGPLQWHFIGPIQSNKTRRIAESFDWVQSVGDERIARRLSEQRPLHLPPLNICLQVNASGEASKSGCEPDQALALAEEVAKLPGLALRGLMAIPEPTEDAALQARRFGEMKSLFDRVRQHLSAGLADDALFDTLSMGMSADLEAAIAHGATLVRVGSALFGERQARTL